MTCQHCQELLSPHLDSVLSHEEEQNVLAHLAQCMGCAKYLSQLEQNRQLIRALPMAEVTNVMEAQLRARVQSSKPALPAPVPQAQVSLVEGFKVQSQQSAIRLPPPLGGNPPAPPVGGQSALGARWHSWPMLSFGTVATCAASLLFYFAMMQAPPKVSAEEVVASMDQLIGSLDPDEGERVITEETPDEVMPDWSDETDRELFENENEQN